MKKQTARLIRNIVALVAVTVTAAIIINAMMTIDHLNDKPSISLKPGAIYCGTSSDFIRMGDHVETCLIECDTGDGVLHPARTNRYRICNGSVAYIPAGKFVQAVPKIGEKENMLDGKGNDDPEGWFIIHSID